MPTLRIYVIYGSNSIHLSSIFVSPTFGTHFQGGSSRRGLKKAGTAEEAGVDTPRRLCIQNYSGTTGKNGKGKSGKGDSRRRERELKSSSGKGKVSIQ